MPKLSDLPSEIYTVILSHVPPPGRQQAVLNLTRALPRSPVPRNQIFEHIIVYTPAAVLYLYQLFRRRKDDETERYNPSEQVKSISVRVWVVDADLVANLLALLSSVPIMQMFVGTTYSPEHLHDIFVRPRLKLRTLQLRFKPYVERATYLPFLQGSYFDSTLVQLTRWPATKENHLKNLSITQDTISYSAHIRFAQPIVFFSFRPLTELAISPIGQFIQALRITVPAKPVISYLASQENSFPQLEFLDISTTALPPPSPERAISTLLEKLIRLRHIVIDRNAGTMPRDSPGWASLGRACALAGVGRAKQKEKEIQEWVDRKREEEEAIRAAVAEETPVLPAPPVAVAPAPAARGRRGRRGLAAATISLRDPRPADATSGPSSSRTSNNDPSIRRIRVVPSPPTLRTFSTAFAGPSNPAAQQRLDWSRAFINGFMDGCRTLNAIWKRMQDSATVRVMRFTDTDPEPFQVDGDDIPAVFRGVTDIAVAGHWIGWEPTEPVICFGTERAIDRHIIDNDGTGRSLADSLRHMGLGHPGAPDGSGANQDESSRAITSIPPHRLISDVDPSPVGGLWADEEFIEWGPGHAEGCGHNMGRQIFG